MKSPLENPDIKRLLTARLHDPFRVLGPHRLDRDRRVVRSFRPCAQDMYIVETSARMQRLGQSDLFEWIGPADGLPDRYRLRWRTSQGETREAYDPYCFPSSLDEQDLRDFAAGTHTRAYRFLGAHAMRVDGIDGFRFAVWAPSAERVSVIGDFNDWDGRCHPMRVRGDYGVWELFIPGLTKTQLYKYEIRNRDTGRILVKCDPFARLSQHRPETASVTTASSNHEWQDGPWLRQRVASDWLHAPLSVYEVHAGSWRRPDGRIMNFRELADSLATYVHELGFTHVELMPITEYPFDDSWGYQATGYFAPTSRYGGPDDLRYLVDRMHAQGIGVILDWVPGHFPRDAHGLAAFDDTALFEYGDPRKAEHADWGTLIFNYDRNEVRSFLISSALYWLDEFHFDALRVDAVASMLYLDYSREAGEWSPNVFGGNENLEAIAFLRQLNETTHREVPGSLMIAEESTAFPGVSRPTYLGGLGFSLKWNMGWMHDTLQYFSKDPVHRRHHHDLVTFGPVYAFSENFVLPFSHDEVVHEKRSLLGRMPGDDWQRFGNLRLLFTFQWTFPGKKLLFMGSEFAQPSEWSHRESLAWALLEQPRHAGIQRLIQDLNTVYSQEPALHHYDFDGCGFEWLRWDDADSSVLSYLRKSDDDIIVVLLNMTPVPRRDYRIGVPAAGQYREILNSDSRYYGGSDLGNPLPLASHEVSHMSRKQCIDVTLPPLGGILLRLERTRRGSG